jgi:hypothetical protein
VRYATELKEVVFTHARLTHPRTHEFSPWPLVCTLLSKCRDPAAGKEVSKVKYDEKRVDEAVLALMHLTTFRDASGYRTWKGHDWEVLNRLHEKGFIANPKSKTRSVDLTDEGQKTSEDLFRRQFI